MSSQGEWDAPNAWGSNDSGPPVQPVHQDRPDDELTIVGPPIVPLALAGCSVIAAAVLLLVLRAHVVAVLVAWFLGGWVTVISVGIFLKQDNDRRARAIYNDTGWARPTAKAMVIIGIGLAALASWVFADWVARQ